MADCRRWASSGSSRSTPPARVECRGPGQEGRPPEADHPDTEQQRTPPTITALDRIESAIRSLRAEEDERYRQAADEREIEDLNAQKEMAWSTYWMLVATAFAVFLTGVGVLLIWRTLHHTRRAADYASSMLDEARKTTSAAMEAVGVERAWVIHDDYRIFEVVQGGANGVTINHSIGLQISVRNAGRSPAINFRPHLDDKIIGFNEALTIFVTPPFCDLDYFGSSIGPGVSKAYPVVPGSRSSSALTGSAPS